MSEIIFEIEEKRNEIQRVLSSPLSCYKKLSLLSDFFSLLLSTNNKNILQAYSAGLITPFSNNLATCDVACVPPEKHNLIIAVAEAINASKAFPDAADTLQQSLTSFNEKVKELTAVLNGEDGFVLERNNYLFPLVDTANDNSALYGMLDSITVKILKGKQQTFHLIPSEKEIEARIKTQIETSWNVAVAYARKYIKHISPTHEVIVSFDKRVGFYIGDSLGVALTLAYINELFLFYNAPLTISANEGSCFTGSILQNGEIPSIGEENITKKVELVFYSNVKTFVLPKEDEAAAEEKLRELKKKYPNRNLKLIAVADIEDLLSRRNVVDIKKLSLLKRTGKTVVRNKTITALVITVLSMLSFFYFYEYDDNPYGYEATASGFNIKNQSGKVLWTIKRSIGSDELINQSLFETHLRVVDLNGDKKNEVIYCFDSNDAAADKNLSDGVAFYDYKGKVFNRLAFTKTVYSKREILTPRYAWSLWDTLTFNGGKSLLSSVNNGNSYASAAFILDLKTQKIISDTLWNCGHINEMRLFDLNNDGRREIAGLTHDNGNKRISFFNINLSKFAGQLPSTEEYRLLHIIQAEVTNLFLFPKTDYIESIGQETANLMSSLAIDNNSKTLRFTTLENTVVNIGGIIYNWNYQNNDFDVAISGRFGAIRDSLVAQGKLQKPFTDTWEYRQLIHDQILRWNGKDFVPIRK
ncbi:MAG: hypothetical protein WC209_02625 [Ignavibacteriaceae bacterium]|jgi:hypothetical protein